jgi:hypothetical protein
VDPGVHPPPDAWYQLVASLRLRTADGEIVVMDGRLLHQVERLESPRRYLLSVLHAIVDQLEAA